MNKDQSPIQLNEGQIYQLPGGECVRFEGNDVEGSTDIEADKWVHPLDRGEDWVLFTQVITPSWLMYHTPGIRMREYVTKPDWRGAEHACPEAFDGKMIGTQDNGGFAVVASQDWWQELIDEGGPKFHEKAIENIRRWNIIKEYLV